MHLQLTLLESVLPLVMGGAERHHSPWQDTMRPSQGVLHGLYVFRVIDDFLTALLKGKYCDTVGCEYLIQRKATITNEIAMTAGFEYSKELTASGRRIVQRLLKSKRLAE